MERSYRPLIRESAFRRRLRIVGSYLFNPFLWMTFIPLYRLRVSGQGRLKTPGAAVSIMNHCIYIEWFFVWHAAWPRLVRFTAEQANILRPDAGWFNWIMGVMGIPEDHPMAIAATVRRCLNDGELVHFFPEGFLKPRNQKPGGFMIGAAWFACLHEVPLIPVTEVLLQRPIHRFLPWWPPGIKIVVEEPMHPRDFHKPGERLRHRAARMTKQAEKTIRETIIREGNGYGLKEE